MAGTLALNVEILGEFKKLTQATKGAQGTLGNLNKTASKISSGMNKAFGAIGVGFSLAILVDQFKQASVAAVEEVKSMKLLETAMINTGKATAFNVSEAEQFIKSMMIQTSIADDALRPAYQKLFIATGDVTKSNRLLKIALDASAGTGKDLDAVTQAMARSLAGNDVALNRLIPSLKGVKDPMGELERTFKGAAEAAANTDPYKRMQIIFGEMQEQIGMALLPLLNQFSDWLATPEGQAKLEEIVNGIVAIIEQLVAAIAFIDENKDWLVPMVIGIAAVTTAWNVATAALTAYKTAAGISAVAGAGGAAALAGAGLLGAVGVGAAVGGFQQGQVVGQTGNLYTGGQRYQGAGTLFGGAFQAPTTNNQNVTINVNNGNVNAQQIANAINRRNRSTGTNVIRNIR
jgi:hypothetical protein